MDEKAKSELVNYLMNEMVYEMGGFNGNQYRSARWTPHEKIVDAVKTKFPHLYPDNEHEIAGYIQIIHAVSD